MSGLIIKLGPKERILINGALIENGDRRSRINILTANANILRLKDAIHPKDANTPVRRACYLAQLILSGDVDQMMQGVRDREAKRRDDQEAKNRPGYEPVEKDW